jgi:hypothetical protein
VAAAPVAPPDAAAVNVASDVAPAAAEEFPPETLPPLFSPGDRFSVASFAREANAATVLLPDVALRKELTSATQNGKGIIKKKRQDLRVDGSHHARLAVCCLGAVEPCWGCIHNTDSECQNVLRVSDCPIRRHKAGEESIRLVRHDILNRYAWVGERGLYD